MNKEELKINEEEKDNIVKKVILELKNKKLLKNPKSSFKSTEKMLYSLNVLPEAIKLIKDEIKQLEEELEDIPRPTAKSNTLVLNERESTYVYGNETLQTRISELKQIVVKANSQIRIVNQALNMIKNDKYYNIIPMYYFDNITIEKIAEECDWAVGTVSKHKKRLMNELKIYIFPDTFLNEL